MWERTYPYAWLGVLADVAPSTDELIYAPRLLRAAPPEFRLYLQVDPDEKIEDWSDDRIWEVLATRSRSTAGS